MAANSKVLVFGPWTQVLSPCPGIWRSSPCPCPWKPSPCPCP